MCVIVAMPPKKTISKKILENCYEHNNDGYGIMAAIDGKLETVKRIGDFKQFMSDFKQFPKNSVRIIHFRYKTHGDITAENCHPFFINENLALMHNGIIDCDIVDANMSDTHNFTKYEVKPLIDALPDLWKQEYFVKLMERLAKGSKLMFLDNEGHTTATNIDMWHKEQGIWFSNKNSLTPVYRSSSVGYQGSSQYASMYDRGWDYENEMGDSGYWKDLVEHNIEYLNKLKEDAEKILGIPTASRTPLLGEAANVNSTPAAVEVSTEKPNSTISIMQNGVLLAELTEENVHSDLHPMGRTVAEHDRLLEETNAQIEADNRAEERELRRAMGVHIVGPEDFPDDELPFDMRENTPVIDATVTEVGETEEHEEEELTIEELLTMNPEDIVDWVQDSPWSATEMLMVLLRRV